jgi:hypothetical protein
LNFTFCRSRHVDWCTKIAVKGALFHLHWCWNVVSTWDYRVSDKYGIDMWQLILGNFVVVSQDREPFSVYWVGMQCLSAWYAISRHFACQTSSVNFGEVIASQLEWWECWSVRKLARCRLC